MLKSDAEKIPLVIVLSGPSGVGKDAKLARIRERGAKFHYVVTATTRPKRSGETHGIDYYFLTKSDFAAKIDRDEFLEYAEVYGNYYGVLKEEVRKAIKKGEDVIIKVDVQGATTLKSKIPHAVFIFLLPPRIDDLSERLAKRNEDSSKAMNVRLELAREEIKKVSMFDYQVINHKGNLDETAETVKAIVIAEKCRVKRPKINI
jgi:guanylate kinase